MEALTVYQPWASLIMLGLKPYELRRWDFSAPRMVGGRLRKGRTELVGRRIVLHASTRPIKVDEVLELRARVAARESVVAQGALEMLERILAKRRSEIATALPLACGLGTVKLGQPKSVAQLFTGTKFMDSDRVNHQLVAWPVTEPKLFPEAVPCRGLQGFWIWPHPVPEECA
jgi:hypothetical protein